MDEAEDEERDEMNEKDEGRDPAQNLSLKESIRSELAHPLEFLREKLKLGEGEGSRQSCRASKETDGEEREPDELDLDLRERRRLGREVDDEHCWDPDHGENGKGELVHADRGKLTPHDQVAFSEDDESSDDPSRELKEGEERESDESKEKKDLHL